MSQAARLQLVLDALRILSPTAFALGDEPTIDLSTRGLLSEGRNAIDMMPSIMQGHLYNMAYVRRWPDGDPPLDASWTPPPDPEFMARLEALRKRRNFDSGWQVSRLAPDGTVTVEKNGWSRNPAARSWGYSANGRAWLEIPKTHRGPANTFVFLRGTTAGDGEEQGNLFRLYFHTRPPYSADQIEALVNALDAQSLPFTLKTLMAPASAARADATVLYLSKRYQRSALSCARNLPSSLLDDLGEATPLFAQPLRPGLAVAEDPPTGESFGMHRLRLVVEAVLGLWRAGIQDSQARLEAVAARFAADGISLEAPHLGPGSTLDYSWNHGLSADRATAKQSAPIKSRAKLHGTSTPDRGQNLGDLELAARIGARLCREALWHRDRCTWQGWAMMERGAEDEFVWRSFGPDLYRGTSGIALFLARLYVHTSEPHLRETILGAMKQAQEGASGIKADVRIGLHTGLAGIGYAALEVGTLLEHPDLIVEGLDILEQIAQQPLAPAMFDIVSGAAGCVPVLLGAAARHDRPQLLDAAVTLGDFLIEQAVVYGEGMAWGSDSQSGRSPLCGYSHGAAGVSLALADLYAATQEERFLHIARAGLNYERDLFRPEAGNWPDLRLPPGAPDSTAAMAWCHGAPGIALARLAWRRLEQRLVQRVPDFIADDQLQEELDIALNSTYRHLQAHQRSTQGSAQEVLPLGNISMCHGAFGNADVLLLAARDLERPALESLARGIGQQGKRLVEDRGLPWPSGNPSFQPAPGLMLGEAGAGHFYLRLHDPDGTPSPLWTRP